MAEACVLLTLSKAEAETLNDILEFVGGSSKNSRRRHAAAIQGALHSSGVRTDEHRLLDVDRVKVGAIYFKNK